MYSANGTLTREILLVLSALFGANTLESALELIDDESVMEIQATLSKRTLLKVRGSSGISYTFFQPLLNRCSCISWSRSTWSGGGGGGSFRRPAQLTCKHVLAAGLAKSIAQQMDDEEKRQKFVKVLTLPEESFMEIINTMD